MASSLAACCSVPRLGWHRLDSILVAGAWAGIAVVLLVGFRYGCERYDSVDWFLPVARACLDGRGTMLLCCAVVGASLQRAGIPLRPGAVAA